MTNKKYKGKMQLSTQVMELLLSLPEGVHISNTSLDQDRDIVTFLLRSNERVEDYTDEVVECAEPLIYHREMNK